MNRIDFQNLTNLRVQEAKALLGAGFPDGAYYLAGYAVECALKACIAKRTKEHDFPDKGLVNDSYSHNLKELIRVALLRNERDSALQNNSTLMTSWTIVPNWSETSRYERKTVQEAAALLNAVEDQAGGLLPWLRQRW